MDPITLDICWNRLIGVVNEQAAALMRTSFTSIVREAGDLSAGVFDRRGYMIAQAVTGTPGHINSMALAMKHFLAAYPLETLRPGDVLITNDPWKTSGHLNDVTVCNPVFRGSDCVAFFASTCHSADIGGHVLSAEAREVYEEGLLHPDHEALRRRPAQRVARRDHPGQHPRPRPRDGRLPRAGRGRHRRGRAPARVHGRVRPRAARAAGRRDHRPHRARHAPGDRRPAARRVPVLDHLGRLRRADHHRGALRDRGRRSPGRLHRLLPGQPARHQRGDELHRGLHDLRGQGHREPRRAQQRGRLPGPPHHRARGLHPERAASRPGGGASHRRPLPAPRGGGRPQGGAAGPGDGRGLRQHLGAPAHRQERRPHALGLHLLQLGRHRGATASRTGSRPPRSRRACSAPRWRSSSRSRRC